MSKSSVRRPRRADFTSENLFRAILVMQREGFDYREASIRIAESETLQNFCRLLKKRTIDFTLLNKAFAALRPETWETIHQMLGLGAVADETVSIDHLRTGPRPPPPGRPPAGTYTARRRRAVGG